MAEYSPFPDAEAVVATALQAAGTTLGNRIFSSMPDNPAYPLAVVQRLGGASVERHRIDGPRIQVDVYGNNKAEARDAADAARIVVHELEGTVSELWSAVIAAVNDETGLTWMPDYDTGRDRYVFSVLMVTHHLD